jgi:hypothetical protein
MKFRALAGLGRVAVVFAILAAGMKASAQSADALIDKLVEKGILTVKEANELREEADKDFARAYSVKSGMADWVTSFRWSGDVRGRYEGFFSDNSNALDRHRLQYRLRLGAYVTMFDNMEVGVRMASAGDTSGNPISSNQTLDNNASKKGLALDLVYGKWIAFNTPDWLGSITVGKMENPFAFAPIVFDPDYTPEGFGEHLVYHLNEKHDLKLNLGQFVLEEQSASSIDSYLIGAQLLWEATWGTHWKTALGIGALAIGGREQLTPANGQLNIGEGNTRVGGFATNPPAYDFNPIVADAAVTYTLEEFPFYSGAFPIQLGAEYLHNPAAPDGNDGYSVKLTFGKSGKRRLWEFSYEWRVLEADAIYEEFPESDFNAFTQTPATVGGTGRFVNGTNIRGHVFKLGYSPFDSFTFFVTYWMTENIRENPPGSESEASRLQVDGVWKF